MFGALAVVRSFQTYPPPRPTNCECPVDLPSVRRPGARAPPGWARVAHRVRPLRARFLPSDGNTGRARRSPKARDDPRNEARDVDTRECLTLDGSWFKIGDLRWTMEDGWIGANRRSRPHVESLNEDIEIESRRLF
jgi:hypothetical protein